MARLMLSDELWSKLKEIMLQHQIYNKSNLRMMVEAFSIHCHKVRQIKAKLCIDASHGLLLYLVTNVNSTSQVISSH